MIEAEVYKRLCAWGIARDSNLLDLTSNRVATQVVIYTGSGQAEVTLLAIVDNFRLEAVQPRYDS